MAETPALRIIRWSTSLPVPRVGEYLRVTPLAPAPAQQPDTPAQDYRVIGVLYTQRPKVSGGYYYGEDTEVHLVLQLDELPWDVAG